MSHGWKERKTGVDGGEMGEGQMREERLQLFLNGDVFPRRRTFPDMYLILVRGNASHRMETH